MRLIDADALFAELKERHDIFVDCEYIGDKARRDELSMAMADVFNAPTIGEWIRVEDRMPAETHSIFSTLYGTEKWCNAMWREQSDKVLVTVAFKDGTRLVTTGETHDGKWLTSISRTLEPIVTHWAEMPEPPEEMSVDD